MLLPLFLTFPLWQACFANQDVRKTIDVPDGQEAILLIGGIADREVKGRTVNTFPQAELVFAEGDHCYPEELVFPDGVAAGIALTNRKDLVASCFGYHGTQPAKDCLIWKKTTNGSWASEAVRANVTGPGSRVLHQVYRKDPSSMLFPSWTHCHGHKGFQADDCAYFFFNTIGDSKDIFLMKIWLEGDKVRLSQPLVQSDTLRRRGCLVVVGGNLFHLGGVMELLDALNMGEQVESVKFLRAPAKLGDDWKEQKWQEPGCKLIYRGYNQACIGHPVESQSSDWEFNILSVGGEMQANDSRHDVSDIRSVKVMEACGGTDGGVVNVPDGKTEGGLLGSSRKDFAFGYLSKNTKQLTHLALAIGGRRDFGRQSEAADEITIVELEEDMTSLTKKSLINRTKLTLGRFGMNFVRVPTKMFLGSVCTVKRTDKSSSTANVQNLVWLNILAFFPLFAPSLTL